MAWGKMIQKDQNFEIWVTFEVAQKSGNCPKSQWVSFGACYWTKWVQTWHAWTWRVNLPSFEGPIMFWWTWGPKVASCQKKWLWSQRKFAKYWSISKGNLPLKQIWIKSNELNPMDYIESNRMGLNRIESNQIGPNRNFEHENDWIEIWNCQCLEAYVT